MDANDTNPDVQAVDTVADTAPAAPAEAGTTDLAEGVSSPPVQTAEGVAMIVTSNGAYPANHRLRAEAMARDGVTTDADGMISDELIASTKDRLERESAEAERVEAARLAAHPPVNKSMRKDDLIEIAGKEQVLVADGDTNATIVANIEAARAANKES